jgi:hypothetical protein
MRARAFAGYEGSSVAHPKEADTAALIAALHGAGVRIDWTPSIATI